MVLSFKYWWNNDLTDKMVRELQVATSALRLPSQEIRTVVQ